MHRTASMFSVSFLVLLAASTQAATPQPSAIKDVHISRPFFVPAIGDKVNIQLRCGSAGRLTVEIIDRDGFHVRTLASSRRVSSGAVKFSWDGKNDIGSVVPDEAYSIRALLESGSRKFEYFPANGVGEQFDLSPKYYDSQTGVIAYTLPKPARVHMQAGSATFNETTKRLEGPVLRTIVNREPRTAGAVIEQWNGMDESKTIHVPDLPHFVITVAATALPENVMITTGNRSERFTDYVGKRSGHSLFTFIPPAHVHHAGSTALQDISPELSIHPENAASLPKNVWRVAGAELRLSLEPKGPAASEFLQTAKEVYVFIDGKLVKTTDLSEPGQIAIDTTAYQSGMHLLAVNWTSPRGTVAVNSMRFTRDTQ